MMNFDNIRFLLFRSACFFFLIVMPLLLVADYSFIETRCAPRENCSGNFDFNELNPDQKTFLIKQYETATQEIKARLEHEHLLFALKFTIAGGILITFFRLWDPKRKDNQKDEELVVVHSTLSPAAAIICWAAVAVMIVIDIRSHFNSQLIAELGTWVGWLETSLGFKDLKGCSGLTGWENFFSKSPLVSCGESLWESLITHPIIRLDRQLFTWLLYAVTTYFFIFIPTMNKEMESNLILKHIKQSRRILLNIGQRAVPVCLVLFGIFGYFHFVNHFGTSSNAIFYVVLLFFVIGFCIFLLEAMKRYNPPTTLG